MSVTAVSKTVCACKRAKVLFGFRATIHQKNGFCMFTLHMAFVFLYWHHFLFFYPLCEVKKFGYKQYFSRALPCLHILSQTNVSYILRRRFKYFLFLVKTSLLNWAHLKLFAWRKPSIPFVYSDDFKLQYIPNIWQELSEFNSLANSAHRQTLNSFTEHNNKQHRQTFCTKIEMCHIKFIPRESKWLSGGRKLVKRQTAQRFFWLDFYSWRFPII